MNWLLTSYCIIVFTGYRQVIVLLYELVIVLIIDKLLYRLLRSYYMYWLSIRYCTIICTGYLQGTVLLYVLVIDKVLYWISASYLRWFIGTVCITVLVVVFTGWITVPRLPLCLHAPHNTTTITINIAKPIREPITAPTILPIDLFKRQNKMLALSLFLCLMVFNATFNNISTDLSQVTDKLYHIILYTSSVSRFELTTSVVIGTDWIAL